MVNVSRKKSHLRNSSSRPLFELKKNQIQSQRLISCGTGNNNQIKMGNKHMTHRKTQQRTAVCSPSLRSAGMNLLHSKIDKAQQERALHAAQQIIIAAANRKNMKKQIVPPHYVAIPSNADNESMEGAAVLVSSFLMLFSCIYYAS